MKQVSEIYLSHMNNGAHFTFVENVLKRIKADTRAMAVVGKLVPALETAFAEEDKCIKVGTKSMKTDSITMLDKERDRLYSSFRNLVKDFLDTGLDKFTVPAAILRQSLKEYDINIKAQLDKETGMLSNLIDDLETKYSEQVKALGLADIVAGMKAANEQLKTLTMERLDERLGKEVGALKAARAKTDGAYRTIVTNMNAYVVLNGDADLGPVIDVLNLEIQHYRRDVLNRKSDTPQTSAPGDTGGTAPDPGTTPDPGDKPGTGSGGTGDGGSEGDGGTSFD